MIIEVNGEKKELKNLSVLAEAIKYWGYEGIAITRFSTFGPEPEIEVVGDELAGEF